MSGINNDNIMVLLKVLLLYSLLTFAAPACVTYGAGGCDYRCFCCNADGISNNNCDSCNSGYYMWLDSSGSSAVINRCELYCPPGQYVNTTTTCNYCHSYCQTCNAASFTNCLSCASNAFMFNDTTCYNLPYGTYSFNGSNYYNPCVAGTYAWPLTMVCLPCPTGCVTCSLGLEYLMPASYQSTKTLTSGCTNDPDCLQALQCYTCNSTQGYIWVQGNCMPINQCREYTYYASSSSTFDPAQCLCLPNYYQTGVMKCSRCHITCYNCTYNDDSHCAWCPTGFNNGTSAGPCSTNGTYVKIEDWTGHVGSQLTATDGGTFTASPATFKSCGSTSYLWGCFENSCVRGTLNYVQAGIGVDHYGIRLRFAAVFIDGWPSTGAIYVTAKNSAGTYQDAFSYNYYGYGTVGEFLCNKNTLDIVQVVDGWFLHSLNDLDFILTSNGASVGDYYFGMSELIIYKMICHATCATCSGPTEDDCLTCPNTGEIVFNGTCDYTAGNCTSSATPPGKCVCDTAQDYFLNSGSCSTSCPAPNFRDKASRACVPSCPAPLVFGDTSNTSRFCMISCPSGYYKDYATMTCLSSCYLTGTANTLNYFMFNGSDPACFRTCPSGTVADEFTGSCLPKCTASYFAHNGYCNSTCPSTFYAYNLTNLCVSTCPNGYFMNNKTGTNVGICEYPCTTNSGINLYGDNSTGKCVDVCPNGTFADRVGNMCVEFCNLAGGYYNQLVKVSVTVWEGTCQSVCVSNFLGNGISYGNPITGYCVNATDCPDNYYGDSDGGVNMCVTTCSNLLQYGVNSSQTCETACGPGGIADGYKYNTTKVCIKICPSTPSLFGDQDGYCVSACTGLYYADEQANRTCRLNCTSSPAATFGQNKVCVIKCTAPKWGDPYSTTRACTSNCTHTSPNKSFGYDALRLCVLKCPDTWFGMIYPTGIPKCVQTCEPSQSLFGDNLTNQCTTHCPSDYYGDTTPGGTRQCLKHCPPTYFAINISGLRTCELTCASGYADNATRICQLTYNGCASGTYGTDSTNTCEEPGPNCPTFADPVTQSCVPSCPVSTSRYFGDSSTSMCVLICPNYTTVAPLGLFGDNSTGNCETSCAGTTLRDYQNNRRCVSEANCSRTPVALFGDTANDLCVTAPNCPAGTFGDNYTMKCQSDCQGSTLLYADPVSKFCVSVCPNLYYAVNSSVNVGICNQTCIVPLWADNATGTCTSRCSANTYGENYTMTGYFKGICEKQCGSGEFARDADNLCVPDCGTGLWGDTISRKCLTAPSQCPDGYYANNVSHMCVIPMDCQLVGPTQYVADNSTKQCVAGCPLTSPKNFADMDKQLCVALCPIGKFGDNTTLSCLSECKDYTTGNYRGEFADSQLRLCVQICSSAPTPTFGQNDTFTCVEAYQCPASTWAEDTVYNRQCRPICPPPNTRASNVQKYTDNTTKKCVQTCPENYFGSTHSGVGNCVPLCEVNTLFADNFSKTCVPTCPSSQGTFGDQATRTCVSVCPLGFYAQISNRYCVFPCEVGTWGEEITRVCLTDNTACPIVNKYKQYADNFSHMCVSTCPIGQDTWGQNSTWYCVPTCLTGFKYTVTRVCIDLCPASLTGTGLFSDQGMCYATCISASHYRDPQNSRSCQLTCSTTPNVSYADSTTMNCVKQCPSFPIMYYDYDGDYTCRTTCPGVTHIDPISEKCVSPCPSGSFVDTISDTCVLECPYDLTNVYYGDPTASEPLCVLASNCPGTYYADFDTRMCTQTCSTGLYKNNGTTTCVKFCPDGLYGSSSGYCVAPVGCPTDQYANNLTKTCVSICNGSFADTSNKVCVFVCPTGQYADPYTRKCATNCTNNATVKLYINTDNQSCIAHCDPGMYLNTLSNTCQSGCLSPYFADPSTQICVTSCPISPQLYGDENAHTCVEFCPTGGTQYYTNNQTRLCVTVCDTGYYRDNLKLTCTNLCEDPYFANGVSGYCVLNCSTMYALDDTNECVNNCPSPYYDDSTTYKCVLNCPVSPMHYKLVVGSSRTCTQNCPPDKWADLSSASCVTLCPSSPPRYADNNTWTCVSVCPYQDSGSVYSLYALNTTRMCVNICPGGMYAENTTRTCVNVCPNGTDTYGDGLLAVPACVKMCSVNTYADPVSLTCVPICPASPKTYSYQNTSIRICVSSCPHPLLTDLSTNSCIASCPSTTYPYKDLSTMSCVAGCPATINTFGYLATGTTSLGQCLNICPNGFFSDNTTRKCVVKCPDGYFGQSQNRTCQRTCTLANTHFADSTTNLCVPVCPTSGTYDSYGDRQTRTCVTTCPSTDFTYADPVTRLCEPTCSKSVSLTYYRDPTTQTCVTQCPSTPDTYFADPKTLNCVLQCPQESLSYGYIPTRVCTEVCLGGLYANDETRLCVIADDCQTDYFADDSTLTCVALCPLSDSSFGDPTTQKCVKTCPPTYFRDSSTRMCVLDCPSVPNLYADNSTSDCVEQCPANSYADNKTRVCVATCPNSPTKTFADNSTNKCVALCPTQPNYFADNSTWKCVDICPGSPDYFADYSTRTCVLTCPNDTNNTFADTSSRECVRRCPDPTFNDNSTQRCKTSCTTGFADSISKFCVAICPNYYYGETYTYTCVATCPTKTPALFAEDASRMCVTLCNATLNLYADSYSERCVKVCPIADNSFADNISQSCVYQCPSSPLAYADSSTRTCVSTCPTAPAMWAINSTRVCTPTCPSGSYADNSTRLCVAICSSTPQTFGDNSTWSCVTTCPTNPWTFADNSTQTCVPDCPADIDYYADNLTRRCVTNCVDPNTFADPTTHTCVTVCPSGYYAENSSMRCKLGCQAGFFADVLLRRCVTKCSVDPVYYGNPLTHVCVGVCPVQTTSFGNPLTQECVTFDASGLSGCELGYYSDNSTRLCVPVCPMKEYTFADNSTRRCVSGCPGGSVNTFADNSTMRCVPTCPSMPDYYAQNTTRTCVKLCLAPTSSFSGTFADNSTRTCTSTCPSTPDFYSDNSTIRCVAFCPVDPLTFADYSTRRCVSTCPDTPDIYGDLSTRRCVLTCPEDQSTYADPTTRLCVRVCPNLLFGENDTNRCVANCPAGSYADNSTRLCVAVCPEYPMTYGDGTTNKCVSLCPVGYYADQVSQTCVGLCPFTPNKTYGEETTRQCLAQCPLNLNTYADDSTRTCVATCPLSQGTYGTDINKTCVSQCPDVPFLYAENITRKCKAICPNATGGGFAENISRVCVVKCPDSTYGDPVSLYCMFYCDITYYALDGDNLCVQQCPSPYFADNTTRRCVPVCPVNQQLFGVTLTRTCDPACPALTYADSLTQQCVTNCPPSQDTYAYNGNNTCVKQCPLPLYAYSNNTYVCLEICPNPFYPNITDHRCYKCPNECAICTSPEVCTKCITSYYLYSGTCVASCPLVPVVTYANINGTCGTSLECSAGYFALNSTKSCVQTCPAGYYKNTIQQTCQYCVKGCINCNNYSICLGCNTQTALWDNYTCYPYCSRLKRYYYGSGCASTCPAGTFLNLTFCTDCDATCNTCDLQPSNCLTCADGLYLQNHICVASCPNNSRPAFSNNSLICQQCGTSGLNCSTESSLTYTINQTIQNYKYKLYLTFSKPVNLTGNIKNIIQIIQLTNRRRRLMADASTVNYTIIDYGNGVYGFLINGFDSSVSGGVKFQLQILDPTAIKAADGSIPQQTRMDVVVSETVYYDMGQYNQHFAGYGAFVTGVSILMLIGLVWAKADVWIPMFDVLQMLFVLYFINVVFPPNLGYMLASFKSSFLNWIPNMFVNIIPRALMNSKNTGQVFTLIGDFMFLRNEGYLLTITLILLIFAATMLLLTKNKSIIKDNTKRLKLKRFWKEIILARYIHNLTYILFLPTMFFAFFQMRDYTIYWPVVGFSIFCSLVYLIIMLLIMTWLMYKTIIFGKKYPVTLEALSKSYNIIKEAPSKFMETEENKFTLDKNEIDLRKLEEPRINGKRILPMQIETHFESAALAAPFINYLFKLLVSIFMVASFSNPTAQLLLLIALYLLYMGYLIRVKPYIYKKNNYFLKSWLLIANCVTFVLLLIVMLTFVVKYTQFSQTNRVLLGDVACYLVLFLLTYNIMFFIYRFSQQWYYKMWRPFVYSECFKENFPIEHFAYIEEYENENKEEKKRNRKHKRKIVEEVALIEKEAKAMEVDVTGGVKDKLPTQPAELGVRKKQTTLRPTQKEIIRKDLETFVNDVYEKEKSHTHKSSSSLSRKDRKKMIETIFAEKKIEKHDRLQEDYEIVLPRAATASNNKANDGHEKLQEESLDSEEYSYEEYEEEYPEDADAKEILAGNYKGNVVIP